MVGKVSLGGTGLAADTIYTGVSGKSWPHTACMRGTMKADKYTRCANKLQAHAGPKKEGHQRCIGAAIQRRGPKEHITWLCIP